MSTELKTSLIKTGIFTAALSLVLALPAYAKDDNKTDVKTANAQFYTALNSMFVGDLTAMKEVWSHADDVVYMGPDGDFQLGWDKVLADWKKQAAMKLGGKVTPKNISVTQGKEIAIVHALETGKNTNAKGKPETISIRTTNLFRLENGQWKMIGHHTDKLSYMNKSK